MLFSGFEQEVIAWFTAYAYEPYAVYAAVVGLMLASSFGLPLPEEVIILSSGLVAHIALHPDIYPPPNPEAESVNLIFLACLCFTAVFLSDLLIYALGKYFGKPLTRKIWFRKLVSKRAMYRVQTWMLKYGFWASGIFRFTPGLRFPGHMACGMTGVPISKFIAVDGTAALLTVPTQIILIGYYGETVMKHLKEIKFIFLGGITLFLIYIIFNWVRRRLQPKGNSLPQGN